jgi:hypothetical protein
MSALFGAGIILPTSGSIVNFDILNYLRHAWKALEAAEIEGARLVRNPSVSMRIEDRYRILMHADSNIDILKLNAVAADIWQLCNGQNSVDDIVREVTNHFDVEPDACRQDILLTLMAFKGIGVISLS